MLGSEGKAEAPPLSVSRVSSQRSADAHPTAPGGTFRLGGRTVARIGFGTMQLAGGARPPVAGDQGASRPAARRELGVNHFDTAQFYGTDGQRADPRGSPALPGRLVIVTKVGARRDPGRRPRSSPRSNRTSCASRSRRTSPPSASSASTSSTCAGPTADPASRDRRPGRAARRPARRARRPARRGQDRRDRAQQRHARPAAAGTAGRHRLRAERAQPRRAVASRPRPLRANGIAWVPFFPLGSAFPGAPKVTDQTAVRGSLPARRDPFAGRPRVAAGALAEHPPHLGHVDPEHLEPKHRRRLDPARRGHAGGAGGLSSAVGAGTADSEARPLAGRVKSAFRRAVPGSEATLTLPASQIRVRGTQLSLHPGFAPPETGVDRPSRS